MSYEYTICAVPSEDYFKKQCQAIEKRIPKLKKEPLIEDVDGSKIQVYSHKLGKIKVYNDFIDNCLYVISDFDITPYFD